jgi:REP element-mobilizing transposase RayT
MTNCRRAFLPGGTFFFTLVTERRAPILTTPLARAHLRKATRECRGLWPFEMLAVVLLPDHLHTLWRLPEGDTDYAKRIGWLKKEVTKRWLAEGGRGAGDQRFKAAQPPPRGLAAALLGAPHSRRGRSRAAHRLRPLQPGQARVRKPAIGLALVIVPPLRP